jgi:membrane protein implicated in regulation of membrane protease activity
MTGTATSARTAAPATDRRSFVKENGLSLFFGTILLLALAGQAFAGLAEYNQQQLAAGLQPTNLGRYLISSDFAVDVAENWQSEFLQFLLYIWATVWLFQRGSSDSKQLDKPGRESDEEQLVGAYATDRSPAWARAGGWRLAIYSRSLVLIMGTIFFLSWLAQSIAGHAAYNSQQLSRYEDPVSWLGYVSSSDFWSRTLQNWQSEFLAVASMAVFAIYLRQRGSPESKPVGAPHDRTGAEG